MKDDIFIQLASEHANLSEQAANFCKEQENVKVVALRE